MTEAALGRYDDGEGSIFLTGLVIAAVIGGILLLKRGAKAVTDSSGDVGLLGAVFALVGVLVGVAFLAEGNKGVASLGLLGGCLTGGLFFVMGKRAVEYRRRQALERPSLPPA